MYSFGQLSFNLFIIIFVEGWVVGRYVCVVCCMDLLCNEKKKKKKKKKKNGSALFLVVDVGNDVPLNPCDYIVVRVGVSLNLGRDITGANPGILCHMRAEVCNTGVRSGIQIHAGKT